MVHVKWSNARVLWAAYLAFQRLTGITFAVTGICVSLINRLYALKAHTPEAACPRKAYNDSKEADMANTDNKEVIEALRSIEKQLIDIKYDVADIKRQMPKVPYYGDLLEDIARAVENIKR